MGDPSDKLYEDDVARNPRRLRSWLRYIDHKRNATIIQKDQIYRRALVQLPGSYKLWKEYLDFAQSWKEPNTAVQAFEAALIYMHKMPRIWLDYLETLWGQLDVTNTRLVFNRALCSLPIEQHGRLWDMFCSRMLDECPVPETLVVMGKRYAQFNPDFVPELVDVLVQAQQFDVAVEYMNIRIASLPQPVSLEEWKRLVEICLASAQQTQSLGREAVNVESTIRNVMPFFHDQLGWIWTCLANYFIRLGMFERARAVYEEGMDSVVEVGHFAQIYDAYTEYEETMAKTRMSLGGEHEADLGLARLEHLVHRGPFLMNKVKLGKDPNNVSSWKQRIDLHQDLADKMCVYKEAFQTIEPSNAVGMPLSDLWKSFADCFQEHEMEQVYEQAVMVPFREVEESVTMWIEYSLLKERLEGSEAALELLARATKPHAENRVSKSRQLWIHVLDMEKRADTNFSSNSPSPRVVSVYNRMMALKVATPRLIIEYGGYLESHGQVEDAFRIYEKAIDMLAYPAAFEVWNIYLAKILKRCSKDRVEYIRYLFESVLDRCPIQFRKQLFVLYGLFEERHGFAGKALEIYRRATQMVAPQDKLEVYEFCIGKHATTEILSARDVYHRAIEDLEESKALIMCLKFAKFEAKLGEFERARCIFEYGSRLLSARIHQDFWETWKQFELANGNEDTFRNFLQSSLSTNIESPVVHFVKGN